MREILDAVASGELSPAQAEAELRGYATGDAGRFDATRERRSGVPEAVLGDGKSPGEVASLLATSLETTGRAIGTRLDDEQVAIVREVLGDEHPEARITYDERAGLLVSYGPEFTGPSLQATVCVVSAGTADTIPATEAAIIAGEMGAEVDRIRDVGIAAISRLLDRLGDLRSTDVIVVAAGREGALPSVIAGLVDVPVIGLPVSTGYGHGGSGEAALTGMLQSCTALSVVNIDAGFTAGAQAGLIARRIDAARKSDE